MWKQVYSILLLAERQTKEARARLSGPGISGGMTCREVVYYSLMRACGRFAQNTVCRARGGNFLWVLFELKGVVYYSLIRGCGRFAQQSAEHRHGHFLLVLQSQREREGGREGEIKLCWAKLLKSK